MFSSIKVAFVLLFSLAIFSFLGLDTLTGNPVVGGTYDGSFPVSGMSTCQDGASLNPPQYQCITNWIVERVVTLGANPTTYQCLTRWKYNVYCPSGCSSTPGLCNSAVSSSTPNPTSSLTTCRTQTRYSCEGNTRVREVTHTNCQITRTTERCQYSCEEVQGFVQSSFNTAICTPSTYTCTSGQLQGDLNKDNLVNVQDSQLLIQMINNPSLTFHPWQKITCADLNSDGVLQVNDVQLLTTLIQNQPVGRVKPRVGNQPQIQIPFTRSRTGEKTSVRSSVLNFFRRSSSTRN